MPVKHAPLNEKRALIAAQDIFAFVVSSPVAQLSCAQALLNFPACQIGVNEDIALMNKRCSRAVNHRQSFRDAVDFTLCLGEFVGAEKFIKLMAGEDAEHTVIRQILRQ